MSSINDKNRHSQSTGYAKTVVGSSLAPQAALLKPFSGSTGSVVHPCGFIGAKQTAIYSHAPLVKYSSTESSSSINKININIIVIKYY